MNRRAYITAITLIGKLANEYKFLDNYPTENPANLTPEETDLVRDALREFNFYHAHERVDAGVDVLREAVGRSESRSPEEADRAVAARTIREPRRQAQGITK
jgi:hypothetical protein